MLQWNKAWLDVLRTSASARCPGQNLKVSRHLPRQSLRGPMSRLWNKFTKILKFKSELTCKCWKYGNSDQYRVLCNPAVEVTLFVSLRGVHSFSYFSLCQKVNLHQRKVTDGSAEYWNKRQSLYQRLFILSMYPSTNSYKDGYWIDCWETRSEGDATLPAEKKLQHQSQRPPFPNCNFWYSLLTSNNQQVLG